jgi:glutaminyl-tRNA synthetase
VQGYDDPRLPTLAGLRRRGYTSEAIHEFCKRIGVAKTDSTVDVAVLEDCIREDLNKQTQRVMAVMNPVKVVITNYPENQIEELDIINNPENPDMGTRKVPFARELYIEQEDFREDPPPKYFRLAPGREVRLRNAYFIKCESVVKDEAGNIMELHCTYDPATRGGDSPDGRKVKATLHWVAANQAIPSEARLYGSLFTKPNPDDVEEGQDYLSNLNPDSLQVSTCYVEPSVIGSEPGTRYQFERQGYFCVDRDSTPEKLCFNRTVTLRDSWAKIEKAMKSK